MHVEVIDKNLITFNKYLALPCTISNTYQFMDDIEF